MNLRNHGHGHVELVQDAQPEIFMMKWPSFLKEYHVIFSSSHLKHIIISNKYCTYNKLIPKISHVKTLQNLCKMRYKKNNMKVRNKML